ncbi:helix-turn-helix domain-containing protein [Desulfomonile tiedjei]|uniref:DNA-binding protein, excisionase family n=1 Tax=Desulfomonile tiedjei (strain ATCC 49306 / DSM 6799 / DCB-1) TaxID=706587 RepID=I4CEN9_DESTA|nr:MEDS domain-containing protein [Desulfomonile tiedjei]AFM28030.1 DNA-binding protein, excisionase family [Desulfomonile tiedjei DSM 6799]
MDLLTVEEVASILRAHTNTVYKMCRLGQLPAAKFGKEWRIDREKLAEFMQKTAGASPLLHRRSASVEFVPGHTLALMAEQNDVWDFEASFFRENARKGYLLFKACWWQKPEEVRKVLTERGFPVAKFEAAGEMVIADLASICERSGPMAAADAWRSAAHRAIERGYKGMIGSGSPTLEGCCSRGELFTFEEALDGFLDGLPVKGVCAYHLGGKASGDWNALVRLMNFHGQVLFRAEEMDVSAKII